MESPDWLAVRVHGVVPLVSVQEHALELLERCGGFYIVERVHGINNTTLRPIVNGDHANVQLRTVQRVLAALVEQRKIDRRNGATHRKLIEHRKRDVENIDRIDRQRGRSVWAD